MQTSSVTQKGQITVPSDIRRALGFKTGSKVRFIRKGDGVLVEAVEESGVDSLFGIFKAPKGRGFSDIDALIDAAKTKRAIDSKNLARVDDCARHRRAATRTCHRYQRPIAMHCGKASRRRSWFGINQCRGFPRNNLDAFTQFGCPRKDVVRVANLLLRHPKYHIQDSAIFAAALA